MIMIRALGTLEIRSSPEPLTAILEDRETAAVLAYLVLARPGVTHHYDALVDAFWPGLESDAQLTALDRVLDILKEELAAGVLDLHGEDQVGIVPRPISCDVFDFEDATAARRWRRALELYQGRLLEGLEVPGALGYQRWRDAERDRLQGLADRARQAVGG